MTYDEGLSITGLQEAQADNQRHIAMMKPTGELGAAIREITVGAQRYAITITHVITGSLRASHRMEVKGLRGKIYIDPSAINPRTEQMPVVYGFYENKRGGEHAFYDRTVDEYGRESEDIVLRRIDSKL